MYAALAVALICVVIGLPMWWFTTTTYRANLPYSEIQQLAKSKITVVVPTDVWLCLEQRQGVDGNVYKKLEQRLSLGMVRLGDLSINYRISVHECSAKTTNILLKSKTIKDFDSELEEIGQLKMGRSDIYILSEQHFNSSNQVIVSRKRRGYVKFEQDLDNTVASVTGLIRNVFTNERIIVSSHSTSKENAHRQDDVDSMRALRSNPGYELSFNLLNPDPANIHYSWDIASGIQTYLQPFLDKLSEFADFGVESQVLYYTKLAVKARKSAGTEGYILPYELLAHVINPIEARLGSHISTNPDLNFIVYLPTKSQSPLYVMDARGNQSLLNAFLSPRWGGVLVYNAPEGDVDGGSAGELRVDMRHVMEVFVGQLRLLLGIPDQTVNIFDAEDNCAVTDWEVDVLFRSKILENIASASSTLTSLSQLLGKIPNMVIKDNVAKEVYSAVETVKLSEKYLAEGNVYRAFHASKKAIQTAEEAFFDSSLLELLYFPEDQKFAIYIPLFLPIMLPIVSSVYKAVKWLRGGSKESKDKKD